MDMDPSNNNGGVLSASETNSASEESGIAQVANNNNNNNNNGGLISSASEESGITEVSNNNTNNGDLPSASEESCLITEAQKHRINALLRTPPPGLELDIDESLWADLNSRVYSDQVQTTDNPYRHFRASHLDALFIRIGSWQRQGRRYGDVVAKFFFGWKRMVWEIREAGFTNKIEIKWEQIVGMRVFLGDGNQLGILEVELNRPPLFFKETDPRPRRFIRGDQVPDFTDDQATNFRNKHHLIFPRGAFNEHFEKLIECEPRFLRMCLSHYTTRQPPSSIPTMPRPPVRVQVQVRVSLRRNQVHQAAGEPSVTSLACNRREAYNPLTQFPSGGNENQFSANSDFEGAANGSINGSASLTGIEEAMNAVSIHVMNGNNYGQVESTGSETPEENELSDVEGS